MALGRAIIIICIPTVAVSPQFDVNSFRDTNYEWSVEIPSIWNMNRNVGDRPLFNDGRPISQVQRPAKFVVIEKTPRVGGIL